MSNAIFTDAGRALIAGCLANGAKLTITSMSILSPTRRHRCRPCRKSFTVRRRSLGC